MNFVLDKSFRNNNVYITDVLLQTPANTIKRGNALFCSIHRKMLSPTKWHFDPSLHHHDVSVSGCKLYFYTRILCWFVAWASCLCDVLKTSESYLTLSLVVRALTTMSVVRVEIKRLTITVIILLGVNQPWAVN